MSKSSRRKKSPQEDPVSSEAAHPVLEESLPEEGISGEGDSVTEPESAEHAIGESSEGMSIEILEETSGASEGETSLPESVPGEVLAGEVPQGEVPSLPLVLESILFASQKALTAKELAAHLRSAAAAEPASVAAAYARIREADVAEALTDLQADVAAAGRAYQVRETATGWILSSGPGFAPWLRALYPEAKPTRLSPSALETLAIIAYRQPITRADMEAVRGVSVDGVMQTLLDRGLVRIAGRAEVAGRPLLYATTQFFLDHFGLRHLDELPNASELRTIPLPQSAPADVTPSAPVEELPLTGDNSVSETEATAEEAVVMVEVTEILEVRESVDFEEVIASGEVSTETEATESVAGDAPAGPAENPSTPGEGSVA